MGQRLTADLLAEEVELRAKGIVPGPIVMVPVLTGAILFVADLVRAMPVTMSRRPVTVSSYPGAATSSHGASIQHGIPTDLAGKRIILVDDILDSGQTLGLLRRMLSAQQLQSIRIVVLLTKRDVQRIEDVPVEYSCFDIGNEFVIGYGLDYDGNYRNVPDIAVLRPGAD
jgi:hypoxanthine phosphoribosyltransferase